MSFGRYLRLSSRVSPSIRAGWTCRTFQTRAPCWQLRHPSPQISPPLRMTFYTSSRCSAQPPSADSLMDNLNDLYGTARDEFEIAMEETESNTVYAADDRAAAVEAFNTLKDAYEQAIREADPETGAEMQRRVGQRIRELEAAIENMQKLAIEGD